MVLAAGSLYLNSKFEEIETDPFKEIFLDDVNATATLAMIEYCYTGRIGTYFSSELFILKHVIFTIFHIMYYI